MRRNDHDDGLQPESPGWRLADFYLDGSDTEDALHPAERQLLACAACGEVCKIGTDRPSERTPDNVIRSPFLRFLVLGGGEGAPVHPRGIQLRGAWIECRPIGRLDKALDLNGIRIPSLLVLRSCVIEGAVDMRDAEARTVNLGG